jgi:hypothetical protein
LVTFPPTPSCVPTTPTMPSPDSLML